MTPPRTALLSVFRKDGIVEFARALTAGGWMIISTGGTAQALHDGGIPFLPIETLTGNPEAFGGRMKTISFQIESGILFDRDDPGQREEAAALGIRPIDMVVCNFYPFAEGAARSGPEGLKAAVELIDVGGPTMVRAAAKNFRHVAVVVDPSDYSGLQAELERHGEIPEGTRLGLAAKAFRHTADYDAEIETFFSGRAFGQNVMRVRFAGGEVLRYGENPHQKGFFFRADTADPLAVWRSEKRQGKDLSYNNLLDLDAVLAFLAEVGGETPAAVVVKHTNPCGAAVAPTAEEAFRAAWEGDPLAAYGGVVGMNRPLGFSLASEMIAERRFVDLLVAPDASEDALALLAERRKSLVLLLNPALTAPAVRPGMEFRTVRGGILVQESDSRVLTSEDLEVVTGELDETSTADLLLAWKIGKLSKSNSIALVRDGQLVGSGVGQQDRKRACALAVEKAGDRARGAVAASDAFFPFDDGPRILIERGVRAILHPGGSIRDQDTLNACREAGVTLVTTRGLRAFRH